MKLEIGSGKKAHAGYKTIDIEPNNNPDIVGDFRTMTFENLEEIRTHHLLEHFDRKEAIEVLKQWYSWLKPEGRLIVETPDFEGICNIFTNQPQKYWGNREMMAMHAYGSQEADWAFHRDGWWKEKFEKILPEIGFRIELIKQKHSNYRNEKRIKYRLPNILIIAIK